MKTILQKLFFVTSMLLCVTNATAHDFEVNGIFYDITDASNKTVAVTYRETSPSSDLNEYTGSVIIPATVNYNNVTYSVTSIGNYAFEDCTRLRSITIPNSVTSIGYYAFSDCTWLRSITIPNSVTSIGIFAFEYCKNLTNVTIGNSVTSIGRSAFSGTAWYNNQPDGVVYAGKVLYDYKGTMPENTSIIIRDGTLGIADYAFGGCSGLTSIEIPNSVTSIGYKAFYNCTGLTSITIPNSVTSIGDSAFEGCTGLTSITIPNSVTSIGYKAFYNCTGLTSITIPNSVTSIGDYAFSGCSGLTSVTIGNSVTSIGDSAFSGCSGLTSVTIPNSVTSIGKSAFSGCRKLTSVTIPNSVTSIGGWAFNGCNGLTSVTIGNSVTSIGDSAFYGCNGLTSVTIGNSVTSIGDYAFSGCRKLTSVTIPNSVTSIGNFAFQNCTGLTTITIPNSVTNIGNYAFNGCTGLTTITIPNSVTNIGNYAFYGCTGLKEVHISDLAAWCGIDFEDVLSNPLRYAHNLYLNGDLVTELVIPDGVNEIKQYAFNGCKGLTSITIPNSVTSIGENAFDNTTWYNNQADGVVYAGKVLYKYKGSMPTDTNIQIKDGTQNIAAEAFLNCTGLTSITIPNSVTNIGNYAFYGCTGLKEVHISDLAAWCGIDFEDVSSNPLYHAHNLYLNGDLVTELVIPIPDGVNEIKQYAFWGCTGLTSVTIPNSVTNIGNYAFNGCKGLTSITIPNSVTSIGENAFDNTTWYNNQADGVVYAGKVLYKYKGSMPTDTNIQIKDGTQSIAAEAFENCTGLTSITIPNSVTSIGERAFDGCSELKEVHISDFAAWCGIDFEDVLSNPLRYAHNLYLNGELVTELVIPDGVNEIKQYAFYSCTGLKSITIPNSVTSIGDYAFDGCTGLTSVTIPNSVTSIGGRAFQGCTGLKTVVNFSNLTFTKGSSDYGYIAYHADNVYNAPNGSIEEDYIFGKPNEVNTLLYYLGNRNELNLPVDYKGENYVIGDNVFKNYTTLTSVTIPNSVTSIGKGTFKGCTGITSITIPNSVTSIGGGAFQGCTGLKTVVNFSNLTFTKGSSDYGYIAYHADNVYNAPNGSIEEDYIFGKPNEVNTLLYYLGNRNELNLPVDYKGENYVIGDNVFKNYTTLTSVTIPNSVTSIGKGTFKGCTGLTSITIPNSVTSIGESAFEGCTELESVTIGNSVRSIGGSAFNGCNNVMSIYNFSEKAITCSEDIFSTDTYNNATLYVPRGRVAAYSRTTPWNSFYIEEMKEFNITYIVDGEEYMVVKVEYGATIEPLEEPTKEGHTFSGWREIPETMPAEDITITGSFTVNSYIVTFMIDGEVYDTATVEYGTEIELPTPPEKEGYIFSGWVGVPETMPAEDIVIEGSYEVDTTGINAIELDLERNEVYNLNGLRITETENLTRGIYIINGRKVFVK